MVHSACIVEIKEDCQLETERFTIPKANKKSLEVNVTDNFKMKFNSPIIELLEKPKLPRLKIRKIGKVLEVEDDLLDIGQDEVEEMEKENDKLATETDWPTIAEKHAGWAVTLMLVVILTIVLACVFCKNRGTLVCCCC